MAELLVRARVHMCVRKQRGKERFITNKHTGRLASLRQGCCRQEKGHRKHEAVPASPVVATISEDLFRNRIERRQPKA